MPPPMPNPSKRITANPIRPARYRPGKAAPEEDSSDEDDDDEDEVEQPRQPAAGSRPRVQPQKPRAPIAQVEDEDDDEEGFVTDEEDGVPTAATAKPPTKTETNVPAQSSTERRVVPSQPVPVSTAEENGEGSSEEESDEESDDSSEEQSSSEDEAPQRKFQRPTFIRKADRQKSADATAGANTTTDSVITAASSTADVDEQTRRLAQAELYIKDKLERDAIARSQGRKAWDDDEELAPEDTVDDTDGLDPAAEHAGWRLRELKRLKRDREAIEAREKEIEELDRRRNLTQAERDAEDRAFLDAQKLDRDSSRGKAAFLSKYHHKGAFFQDDEAAETLRRRDVMGARFQDDVADKTALPEYMRIRDMTKLGKKGRTRYTDLRGEDTGRFGEAVKRWPGAGFSQNNNNNSDGRPGDLSGIVDERFRPDNNNNDRRSNQGPTGANASAVGLHRRDRDYPRRSRSRSRSPPSHPRNNRDRDRDRDTTDSYRPDRDEPRRTRRRRSSTSTSRSRSRSRTPLSPPYARSDRDKRRRIEVD